MSQSKNKLIFTVLFFVTGLLIGSFFNSQSVSALTIEEQSEVMSFPVSPFKHRCSASWSLRDILTNFTYGGSYGSQNSSNYASEYKSYIAPKFDNLKYLIVRGTSSYTIYDVKVIVIYRNHDKYKMFVKKNGTIHYKKIIDYYTILKIILLLFIMSRLKIFLMQI